MSTHTKPFKVCTSILATGLLQAASGAADVHAEGQGPSQPSRDFLPSALGGAPSATSGGAGGGDALGGNLAGLGRAVLPGRMSAQAAEAVIGSIVAELVGARVAPDAPLAAQGLDSLAALELRRQLEVRTCTMGKRVVQLPRVG